MSTRVYSYTFEQLKDLLFEHAGVPGEPRLAVHTQTHYTVTCPPGSDVPQPTIITFVSGVTLEIIEPPLPSTAELARLWNDPKGGEQCPTDQPST